MGKPNCFLIYFAGLMLQSFVLPVHSVAQSQQIDALITSCRAAVDGLAALTNNHEGEVPKRLLSVAPVRTTADVDPRAFFQVLGNLRIQEGYVLDYFYLHQGGDGFPLLYARMAADQPYRRFEELPFKDSFEPAAQFGSRLKLARSDIPLPYYLQYVQADGSPESFLQFVILYYLGDQFYRRWHANYARYRVVCDSESLEKVLNWKFHERQSLSREEKELARKLNLAPGVRLEEQTGAEVSLVVFTPFGGFFRTTDRLSRAFPHKVERVRSEELLHYSLSIRY